MTATRDVRDFLNDIAGACRSAVDFVGDMPLEAYLKDRKTAYAVMRCFEIMGEAVRHLPAALKAESPDVPWETMAAVRNRIVHAYFGIDDTILHTTVVTELRVRCLAWRPWRVGTGLRAANCWVAPA